ncbi:MAG: GTPase ObgE [Bdellovibrionaceae bacterium]|nr:GTPase ObgE [Pseudobdellovibrionaceae bacterium]
MSQGKFVDHVVIHLKSGRGGPGSISFRREAKVPRGGPDGGDGGRGGHIFFKAAPHKRSLLDQKFKKHYEAQSGAHGEGQNRSGKNGEDLIIEIPPGTMIINHQTEELIKDMQENEEFMILKGGLGGKGNSFYKSSVHQAPEIAQKGMPAEELEVRLELKLLADVGLIGFPNVGKSTLISVLSAAKPEIANYPFTTLTPNLGVVQAAESSYIIADIPGLIPGAHQGVGLGLEFLRHIERTKVFVHLIDVDPFNGRDPIEDFKQINFELEQYDKDNKSKFGLLPLSQRPQIIVFNKWDLLDEEKRAYFLDSFERQLGQDVLPISAYTGYGLEVLRQKLLNVVFSDRTQDEDILNPEGESQ